MKNKWVNRRKKQHNFVWPLTDLNWKRRKSMWKSVVVVVVVVRVFDTFCQFVSNHGCRLEKIYTVELARHLRVTQNRASVTWNGRRHNVHSSLLRYLGSFWVSERRGSDFFPKRMVFSVNRTLTHTSRSGWCWANEAYNSPWNPVCDEFWSFQLTKHSYQSNWFGGGFQKHVWHSSGSNKWIVWMKTIANAMRRIQHLSLFLHALQHLALQIQNTHENIFSIFFFFSLDNTSNGIKNRF